VDEQLAREFRHNGIPEVVYTKIPEFLIDFQLAQEKTLGEVK
jgi:hypothetical protein